MAPHIRALGAPRTDPWQVNLTMTATTVRPHQLSPSARAGRMGVCSEFTVFTKIKPGHADALREDLVALADAAASENVHAAVIGTLHDARHVIFDNDTRFMFASVFDGSWDTYIDDLAQTVVGARFDKVFSRRKLPASPTRREGLVRRPAGARGGLRQRLSDLTVQQVQGPSRGGGVRGGAGHRPRFRAALDNPATPVVGHAGLEEAAGGSRGVEVGRDRPSEPNPTSVDRVGRGSWPHVRPRGGRQGGTGDHEHGGKRQRGRYGRRDRRRPKRGTASTACAVRGEVHLPARR